LNQYAHSFAAFAAEQAENLARAQQLVTHIVNDDDGQTSESLAKLYHAWVEVEAAAARAGVLPIAELTTEALAILGRIRAHRLGLSQEVCTLLTDSARLCANVQAEGDTQSLRARCDALALALGALRDAPNMEAGDVDSFNEELQALLRACTEALAKLDGGSEAESDLIHEAFRALHTFKGNCGMLGLGQLESMARAVEDALDAVRARELAPTRPLRAAMQSALNAMSARLYGSDSDWSELQRALAGAIDQARQTERQTRLGELLISRNLVHPAEISAALALKQNPLGEILVELQAVSAEELEATLVEQRRLRSGDAAETPTDRGRERGATRDHLVQVDSTRLRRLQVLVDELTSALNATGRYPAELDELVARVRQANAVADLQPIRRLLKRTRLLPIELAKAQGKRVEVVIRGGELELGYRAASSLSTAFLHLLRNAVDHGIEPVNERTARGKPPHGTITIDCTSDGEQIRLRVSDDGRGLARERIRDRAIELGWLTSSSTPSEDALLELIFAPGFSTATRVSDSSGRGVGMDAVRVALTAIGGSIRIIPTIHEGTTFELEWPVSSTRNVCAPPELELMDHAGELTSATYSIPGKSRAI